MKAFQKYLPIILLTLPLFLLTPSITHAGYFANTLWFLVNNLFGLFVGLAGYLLDFGVNTFVIGFGYDFLHSGVGATVDKLWVNIRDIFNITFIFGLIYIGFKMILNSDDSGTKRWLISLIMAALLVNFSLYITKFVVDFSNILATQIAMKGFELNSKDEVQISSTLMGHFGLSDLLGDSFSGGHGLPDSVTKGEGYAAYGYIFGTALLYIIATFVFAAGGMMLAIRYAALCLYMVLSPLMFIGWVFPQMSGVTGQYWKGFLGRAFFAPLYLLLVYFAVKIVEAFFGGTKQELGKIFTGNALDVHDSFGSSLAPFILSCIFLISAVVVSNKLGAHGASGAISIGKNIQGRMQRGLQQTGRFAARKTVGYGAQGLNAASEWTGRKYNRLDANMRQTKGGRIARRIASVATLGALSDKSIQAVVAAGSRATVAGSETRAQVRERNQAHRTRTNNELDQQDREKTLATQMDIINSTDPATTPAMRLAAQQALAPIARNMSSEEMTRMASTEEGKKVLSSSQFASHLTDAQIKTLADSGHFTRDEISGTTGIKEARNVGTLASATNALDDAGTSANDLDAAFKDLGKTIRGLSNERIQGMGEARLTDERIAMNLTDGHIDHLQQSGEYTTAQINNIKAARDRGLTAIATGNLTGPIAGSTTSRPMVGSTNATVVDPATGKTNTAFATQQRQQLMSRDVRQAGQLPVSVFVDRDMAEHITPQVLEQRMKNGGVSDADRALIETNILDYISDPLTPARVTDMWSKWSKNTTIGGMFSF